LATPAGRPSNRRWTSARVDDCDSTHRLLHHPDNSHSSLWIRLTGNRWRLSTAMQGGSSVSAGWTCEAGHPSTNCEAKWAGSPASSSPTGPRPNAPSSSLSDWGSVNAAAAELDTTWPSLRRRSSATVWACPPATLRRSGSGPSHGSPAQWAVGYPALDPVFVALTRRPSAGERPAAQVHEWLREVNSANSDELSIRLSAHTQGLTGSPRYCGN
jgi:hypothetical protein